MKYVFFDNKIIPEEKAFISITSPAFKFGASIFEAMRSFSLDGINHVIPNFNLHITRLKNSLKILKYYFEIDEDKIKNIISVLIKKNNIKYNSYIRITLYCDGCVKSSIFKGEEVEMKMCITVTDNKVPEMKHNIINCCISSWRRINDNCMPPRVKSACNYENTRIAGVEALENGYDNAILLNEFGKISEAAESSIFFIKDNEIVTPDINSDILESINRKTILEICDKYLSLHCIERVVSRTELYTADEIFLCNTAQLIRPVKCIDNIIIGDGEIGKLTNMIIDFYENALYGKLEIFKKYNCKISI